MILASSLLSACVLDAEHVKTKLVKVCTDSVPMPFTSEGGLASASIDVDGVGATVEHPEARASMSSLELEILTGLPDFSFAESLRLDFIAGGGDLPPARVAEDLNRGQIPWRVRGDSSIDLVDYLVSDQLEMRLEIVGDAPSPTFLASFSACMEVSGIEIED